MIGKNGKRKKSLVIGLLLALSAIICFQINPVLADVPSVLSIEPWTSGTDTMWARAHDTILNITVSHASPTSSHYVDKVEVDIDGNVHDVNLTPQSTVTFVVQYNMGEVTDTPTVQARAFYTVHGWSGWSEAVVVPEFTFIHLLLILSVMSIAVLLLRSMVYSQKDKSVKKLPKA